MNKIVKFGEDEFHKSILEMKLTEKESLLRLLVREITLEKEELNRYQGLLNLCKARNNDLHSVRYEQNIKENEILLEQLERKLNICQNEISSEDKAKKNKFVKAYNGPILTSNAPIHSAAVHQSSLNNSNKDDLSSLSVNAKSLINNFEKINIPASDTTSSMKQAQKTVPNNSKKTLSSQQSLSKGLLKSGLTVEETPVLFTEIKLRKIGLPLDAKEVDMDNPTFDRKDLPTNIGNQNRRSSLTNGVSSYPRSTSVDFGGSIQPNNKDKFLNPNKGIQVAIQNELKELKLKKTSNNSPSPVMNFAVDKISLGRYNFANEKSLLNSQIVSTTPMSTSKSMPFLNSINMYSSAIDESDITLMSVPNVIEEEKSGYHENVYNNFESSSIQNWDSTTILANLYDFETQLNGVQLPSTNNTTNISGFIEMLPGLSNNSWNPNLWKRRFASIANGEFKIYENQSSRSPLNVFEIKSINIQKINDEVIELYDSKGLHSTIRFQKSSDCTLWMDALKSHLFYKNSEIVPRNYDSISSKDSPKILIMDIGSCSIRAGLLKNEPTLPKVYFPNIAAISKANQNVVQVGFEALNSNLNDDCNIIRPLKPDTTLEQIAFTSGTVEFTFKKICSLLNINPNEYVIMLSLPHNVAEATRTKLADVLLLRLNFKGISMCGQSLLALHAYGEPTGVLVDIGHRTEILPVVHGIVQTAAIMRSLYGGHLIQIALSHLLPFESHSLTDFFLVRYIMEKACFVAENTTEAQNCHENVNINLENFNLPAQIPKSVTIAGKDRCLPVEGLFNPDIYSLDSASLPKLIFKSIQSCPLDNRRDLYQSICLSGAATQFEGLCVRLETELKKLVPENCDVKVHSSPNRAHFSYIGACFVALSENFNNTVVNRREWEESRNVALKKWHF